MSAFKLSFLTLAAMAVLTSASLGPAIAQVRAVPIAHTQSGGAMSAGCRDRYGFGYRPSYRRYGYYRPRYRPYYGYPLDLETYSVWRNKAPESSLLIDLASQPMTLYALGACPERTL